MVTDKHCGTCRWRDNDPYGWGMKCVNIQSPDFGDPVYQGNSCECWEEPKYLGDKITDEQIKDIQSGTFKEIEIGDYWIVNGMKYQVVSKNGNHAILEEQKKGENNE